MVSQNDADKGTNGTSVGAAANGTTQPAGPPDPFAPENLRLGQNFADAVGVKKIINIIPVRKPHKHEWVRVRDDAAYQLQTAALAFKEDREDIYLIAQPL